MFEATSENIGSEDEINFSIPLEEQKEETAKDAEVAFINGQYDEYQKFIDLFEDKKDFLKERGVDYDEVKKTIESNLAELLDNSAKVVKKNPSLHSVNSVVDTVYNTAMGTVGFLNSREQKNKLEGDDMLEERKENIEKSCTLLNKRMGELKDYANILNHNEDILNAELTKPNGYLEDFKQYFKEKPIPNSDLKVRQMPSGPSKIKYILFFNKLSNKEIKTEEDLEKELELLTDKFVNKRAVKKSFLSESE